MVPGRSWYIDRSLPMSFSSLFMVIRRWYVCKDKQEARSFRHDADRWMVPSCKFTIGGSIEASSPRG